MRVETTDKALTKKKKTHPTMCVLKKKKKNVNHWHPITVVLVEATNGFDPKKKKKNVLMRVPPQLMVMRLPAIL